MESWSPPWRSGGRRSWRGRGGSLRGGSLALAHNDNSSSMSRGIGRHSREGSTGRPRVICKFFLQDRCHRGPSCTFSHDLDLLPTEKQKPTSNTDEIVGQRDKYLDFKRELRSYHYWEAERIWMTWEHAVNVLDSPTREWQQSIAKDLVDDDIGGPDLIKRSVQVWLDDESDATTRQLVAEMFLKTITHSTLLRCLSVDTFIGTVYHQLGGVNGDQGIEFLGLVCATLTPSDPQNSEMTASYRQMMFGLVVSALHELLRRNRKILVNDGLPRLAEMLRSTASEFTDGKSVTPNLSVATFKIDTMLRMVNSARSRLVTDDHSKSSELKTSRVGPVRSTFPLNIVIPGGKHDNDYPDITKISIYCTLQEIQYDGPEYLPTTDITQPSFLVDPVERHLDTAFRLLRHDIFGPFKEAVSSVLRQPEVLSRADSVPFLGNNARAHAYSRAAIQQVFINGKYGLEAILSFSPPPQLRNRSLSDRRRWWKDSPRLDAGGLVCLVATLEGNPLFLPFVVTNKTTNDSDDGPGQSSLVSDSYNPSVTVKLACETREHVRALTRFFVSKNRGILIDFPGLIPDTFVFILKSLQTMMLNGDLAFHRWILPQPGSGEQRDETKSLIPPPVYARKAGFCFDLDTITKAGHESLRLDPACPDGLDIKSLEDGSGLDRGQCEGLVAALTREFALIQGPPGTGKSYLGVQLVRVLLAHKYKADLGPIIVICYTNHALDQFLTHLDHVGISSVIRIGGQSKAEELEGKNLRVVSQTVIKTGIESHILKVSFAQRMDGLECAGRVLKEVHQARKDPGTWKALSEYLWQKHTRIAIQLSSGDEDGFQVVGSLDPLQIWSGKPDDSERKSGPEGPDGANDYDFEDLSSRADNNIYSLSHTERRALANHWFSEMLNQHAGDVSEYLELAANAKEEIDSVHADVNRRALLQADVVGITTTGLARNIDMIRCLGSKVIICEEAAEVLEPHLICSLMPGVEHYIQIGDHSQLRPQIQNYQFSLENAAGRHYALDRSQFERLAQGDPGAKIPPLPLAQLNVQRRMRPEISNLIRSVYPRLVDHPSVTNRPSVSGMLKTLFWLDHHHLEHSRDDGSRIKSRSNAWEVSMGTALVRHLVRQGEKSSDIVLLTPYIKQLQEFRLALGQHFEVFISDRDQEALAEEGILSSDYDSDSDQPGRSANAPEQAIEKKRLINAIRVSSIDNFQGEEGDLVICSLVRSNHEGKVGFLRSPNRITVTLSRAKTALYLIGNRRTYQHVPMWQEVQEQLEEMGAIGPSLELSCPRHPETVIECSEPEDFDKFSPEGGCHRPCGERLEPCGHRCPAPCHSDALHKAFSCMQPCPRPRQACEHPCPKFCGERCAPCFVPISGILLPCGHKVDNIPCHRTISISSIQCRHPVEKTVPGCGHLVQVECSEVVTRSSQTFKCPTKCDEILPCGHDCPGSCGKCRKEDGAGAVTRVHQKCEKICNSPYGTCCHRCDRKCHEGESCGVCLRPCEVRCSHTRCGQQCHSPCTPCIEPCAWNCKHMGSCPLPCSAPCDRLPCNQRCELPLKGCGHQCPSFCGEECPEDLCQICCSSEKKNSRVDFYEDLTYSNIKNLDDRPIVKLRCGHFYTGESLDMMVGLRDVYTTDESGNFNGLTRFSGQLSSKMPACPDCRVPIQQFSTKRFNRVVNRAVMDESLKRSLVLGRERLRELQAIIEAVEKDFKEAESMSSSRAIESLRTRYRRAAEIEVGARKLKREMDTEQQPSQKLHDAIIASQRLAQTSTSTTAARSERFHVSDASSTCGGELFTKFVGTQPLYLEAMLLELRVRQFTLADKLRRKVEAIAAGGKLLVLPQHAAANFLQDCKSLIAQASEAKLPRLVIQATLYYARIVHLDSWYRRKRASFGLTNLTANGPEENQHDTAKQLLEDASELCGSFDGGAELLAEVKEVIRLCSGPRYEEVTPEELAAIKVAMVTGSGGIVTHAGHWYNCENGHPFAIGECGLPMESARCPECGKTVGGENHTLADGVTRAVHMEI